MGKQGGILGPVVRIVVLTAIYLMVLTSIDPADILVGVLLATALVLAGRNVGIIRTRSQTPLPRRLAGVPALIGGTLIDLVAGTWKTARWLIRREVAKSDLVEVPIPPHGGPQSAAAWGVRVGFVPDTVVVEIDEEKGRMLLHVIDATDPDAVVAEQLDTYRRRQRRVFP